MNGGSITINNGLIMAVASSLSFSIMNVLIKILGEYMHTGEIAFFRGLLGTVFLLFIMEKKHILFSHKETPMLLLRGALGGVSMLCFFISLTHLSLGNAVILAQLQSFFVIIFAAIFLKEMIPHGAAPALITIVAGTAILLKVWEYNSFSVYALIAILGAVCSAAVYTTIRRLALSGLHSQLEIVFFFMAPATIVGAVYMGTDFVMPTAYMWLLILLLSIVSLMGQIFMTSAFSNTSPVLVSFVQYIGIVFNTFWGFTIFGEVLTWLSVIGGILIVGGSMYLTMLKSNRMKQIKLSMEKRWQQR